VPIVLGGAISHGHYIVLRYSKLERKSPPAVSSFTWSIADTLLKSMASSKSPSNSWPLNGKFDVKDEGDDVAVIKTMPSSSSGPQEFDVDSNLALRPTATVKAAYLTWFSKVFPQFAAATASLALMAAAVRPAYTVQPLTRGAPCLHQRSALPHRCLAIAERERCIF